jgi:Spy/CpxP family protein refolding chaperone
MKILKMTGLAVVAGFGLSLAGVHAAQAPSPAAATAAAASSATTEDDEAMAEVKEHHRHHHHGGVTQFIAMSLDTLGNDEAKRPQIEKLQHDLHELMAPARDAEKELLGTLADGVTAGTMDKGKLDASIGKVRAAADAVHAASLDTLNKLHEILSPAERAALADKVQAHWDVWRQVNHEAEPGGRERGGHLAALTERLSLTPDQVSKISGALHTAMAGLPKFDSKNAEAHVHAFSTGFAGDSFDAKSVASNANGELAGHGATRMALFYETVTPLLTPEQRTKLAEHLREHASH